MLASTLLLLFGMVVGILALAHKVDRDQLSNISEYQLPLLHVLAEFDVNTDRYELESCVRSGPITKIQPTIGRRSTPRKA